MPTVLTNGDIQIERLNYDADTFSFYTLRTIDAGTVISFTDNGWTGTSLRTTEGTITWTATSAVQAGTWINFDVTGSSLSTTGGGTATMTGVFELDKIDQVLAYQGSQAAPSFVAGYSFPNQAEPSNKGVGERWASAGPIDDFTSLRPDAIASLPNYDWNEAARWLARGGSELAAPSGTTTIQYAFANSGFRGLFNGETGGVMSAGYQALVVTAMNLMSDVANVQFTNIAPGSTLAGNTLNPGIEIYTVLNPPGSGFGGHASLGWAAGHLAMGVPAANPGFVPAVGSLDFATVIHELGHSLGLAHPMKGEWTGVFGDNGVFREGTAKFTEMSYFTQATVYQPPGPGTIIENANYGTGAPETPLLYDVAALQLLYGVNATTRLGDTIYGFNSNIANRPSLSLTSAADNMIATIYDRGGTDTLDFSLYSQKQTINLNIESFSSVGGLKDNVSIARFTVIENAKGGSGEDTFIGNSSVNILNGNSGNDFFLNSGLGADSLFGGLGNDTFNISTIDSQGDYINGQADTDTIRLGGAVDARTTVFEDVEQIWFDGLNTNPAGTENRLIFNAAQFGGTGLSASAWISGTTDVGFNTGAAAEVDRLQIYLNGQASLDLSTTVYVSWNASDFTEIFGNDNIGVDIIQAGNGNDFIFGYAGNDSLRGGLGVDQVYGGLGNDTMNVGRGEARAGETYDGGDGTADVLRVAGSGTRLGMVSFVNSKVINTEIIAIDGSNGGIPDEINIVELSQNQFLTGEIANTVRVEGWNPQETEVLRIQMTSAALDITGMFQLAFWSTNDYLEVAGTTSADTITATRSDTRVRLLGGAGSDQIFGGSLGDVIRGGAQADNLEGNDGDDTFVLFGGEASSGEVIRGGAGTNTLLVAGRAIARDVAFSDIQCIVFDGGRTTQEFDQTYNANSLALNDSAFLSGGISAGAIVRGSVHSNGQLIAQDSLEIFSLSNARLDLSSLVLENWNDLDLVSISAGPAAGVANHLTGTSGRDTLTGLDGNDVLKGGLGNDTLFGGDDMDTADWSDATGDIIFTLAERGASITSNVAGIGVDTLLDIENLIAGSGTDTLTGNSKNNTLNGGLGADRLSGLNGDDLYYVDNALDTVLESAGNGAADRVLTTVDFTLGVNQEIELFSTTNSAGTGAINLTGNNLANTILGNNGVNVLNGGIGIDRMTGLNGNDLYYVDNFSDVVVESAGGGSADRVLTSVNYVLADNQQIELFSTTDSTGTTAINLVGNNLANRILGNNGANVMGGGLGNDVMTGGLGSDQFRFSTAITGGGNVDTITDFVHLTDDIQLAQSIFTGIGGTLDVSELRLGSSANAATQRIVYDGVTGNLFFDADGSGATAQVQFAKLTAGIVLDVNDFIMI